MVVAIDIAEYLYPTLLLLKSNEMRVLYLKFTNSEFQGYPCQVAMPKPR